MRTITGSRPDATVAHMYKSTYAYDANGNITHSRPQHWDQHGDHYDILHYTTRPPADACCATACTSCRTWPRTTW